MTGVAVSRGDATAALTAKKGIVLATGGGHGNNRAGTCAISEITVFGRIAGRNAAMAE